MRPGGIRSMPTVRGLTAAWTLTPCLSRACLQCPPACRERPRVGSLDGGLHAESMTEQPAAFWKPGSSPCLQPVCEGPCSQPASSTACVVTLQPAGGQPTNEGSLGTCRGGEGPPPQVVECRVRPAPEPPLCFGCGALCTAQLRCKEMHVSDILLVFGVGEGTAVLLLHERRMHQGQQVWVQARKHLLSKQETAELQAARLCFSVGYHKAVSLACSLVAAIAHRA